MKTPLLCLFACALLPGCSLIQGFLPKQATLGISIKAPAGKNTSVSISAGSLERTYGDDSRGFVTQASVDAGSVTVRATAIDGFETQIGVTTLSGNKSFSSPATFTVSSSEQVSLTVQYKTLPATPTP